MAMKGYSAFPKAPTLQESHYRIVLCHALGESYHFEEMQSVYSTAPANGPKQFRVVPKLKSVVYL